MDDQIIYRQKTFETLFRNSLDAIISVDVKNRIIDINEKFTTMFGYTLQEVQGKDVDDVMNQGHEESSDRNITAKVLAGQQIEKEGTRYNKNGSPLEVLIRGIPILIDGELVGIFGIYSDITERKRAEKELKERESKYNAIFEGSHDAITIVNEKGAFIDCNRRALELFGLNSKEEFFKYRPADFSPPFQPDGRSSSESSREKITKALNTGEHVQFDWVHKKKSGETFPAEVILMSYFLKGELVLQGTVRDITERKEAEEKLRYISFHDNLTGVYNRIYLDEEIKRLDQSRHLPISIIMADLNGLKLANDTYGHLQGDNMLIKAASILKTSCRKEDIISRWGGDEFVILLPGTAAQQAWSICTRIMDHCSQAYVKDLPVSMALGVSSKTAMDTDLVEVLRVAEDNMYKRKLTESRSAKSAMLRALLKTLAEKSFETKAHTRRMQEVARKIGQSLNLTDSELDRLDLLITLHDIGKINISEEILVKKEALSSAEWEDIKKHPEIGYRIARATEEFAHVAEDILAHHERWDGTGYPQGLKEKQIPLLARIATIADAYEVMTSGRPYKEALTSAEVIAELKRCSGQQFDPELVVSYLSLPSHA